jgi:ankyrin repeat protein
MMAINGPIQAVEILLDNGADIAAKDSDGQTALNSTAYNCQTEIAELLINKGADIESKNLWNRTILNAASFYGCTSLVKLLIDKGADIDARGAEEGKTPLMWAINEGHTDIAELLVNTGADIDSKDNFDDTALMLAIKHGYHDITKLLIESGADVNLEDNKGKTVLILAIERKYYDITSSLINSGADVNAKDNDGKTALILAASRGYTETIGLLIDNGADIEAKDSDGKTALMWAEENGHTETVDLLMAAVQCMVSFNHGNLFEKRQYHSDLDYPAFSIIYPDNWNIGRELENTRWGYTISFVTQQTVPIERQDGGITDYPVLGVGIHILNQEFASRDPQGIVEDFSVGGVEYYKDFSIEELNSPAEGQFFVYFKDGQGNGFIDFYNFILIGGHKFMIAVSGTDNCYNVWNSQLINTMMQSLKILND